MSVDEMFAKEMSLDKIPVGNMSLDDMYICKTFVDEMSIEDMPRCLFFSIFPSFLFHLGTRNILCLKLILQHCKRFVWATALITPYHLYSSLIFEGKPWAYLQSEVLYALPTHMKLGQKWQAVRNTLAFNTKVSIATIKIQWYRPNYKTFLVLDDKPN